MSSQDINTIFQVKDLATYVAARSKGNVHPQVFKGYVDLKVKGSKKVGEQKVFEMSREVRDRHGEVVVLKGGSLSNYNINPVVLSMHESARHWRDVQPYDWNQVIGKGNAYFKGDKLFNAIDFEPKEINPLAWTIESKIEFGSVRAGSIGLIPLKGHYGIEEDGEDTGTYYITEWELIEFSIVVIPANPFAGMVAEDSNSKKKSKTKSTKAKSIQKAKKKSKNIGATAVLLARHKFSKS